MPIHDWTRVMSGVFHDFHNRWTTHLAETLNAGLLPAEFYALSEQYAGGYQPDVLTLHGYLPRHDAQRQGDSGVAVAEAPPKVARVDHLEESLAYARRRKTVVIRHRSGDEIVATIEIASPANKDRARSLRDFVDKAYHALRGGVHLLLIDLFPPGPFDPQGLHGAIWRDLGGEHQYEPPADRPLTLASYEAVTLASAYVEPTAIGLPLTEMPLFLSPGRYINVPLEPTYNTAYAGVPRRWKAEIEAGVKSEE